MSILISDPDQEWAAKTSQFLAGKSLKSDLSHTGKDCQLKIFKHSYEVLVLDFETKNHSALEVLRYMILNHSKVKVILTFASKERFNELGLTKEELLKLGASDIFIKPFSLEALLKSIEGEKQFEAWKKLKNNDSIKDEQELTAVDEEFTHIKADAYHSGNMTIFDLYIRIGKNKYIKILHKGDFFDESRLKKYTEKEKVEFLYFKTKDRGTYINFINDLLAKSLANNKGTTDQRIVSTKSVVEKYIEEIYTVGFKPQLIEEGMKICQNMYTLVQRDKGIADVLRSYEDYSPPAYCHLFLTSFLSTIIAKNLDWTSSRTIEMTALAGLLHDVGQLRLPQEIRDKKPKDMTAQQLILYKTHPLLGVEMLEKYAVIPEPVKQIVYQHHELVNGEGFPNGLTGSKIYPLAKVTSLANVFADLLIERKVTPLEGIREFIKDREIVLKFDSIALKGLVQGFLKDGK